MLDEVDRFVKDESSEEWMDMAAQAIEEKIEPKEERVAFKPVAPCCARCSRAESSRKCSGCRDVNYCSVVCQRLDWAKHKAACREKMQEKTDPSCQHNLEKLVGQPNGLGHEGDHQQSSCDRKEGQLGKSRDAGICNGESPDAVGSTALPRSTASVQTSSVESETQLASSVPPRAMSSVV